MGEKEKERASREQNSDLTEKKLSFMERKELAEIPEHIETVEGCVEELQIKLSDPEFYQSHGTEIAAVQTELKQKEDRLVELYERWEELAERE